MFPYQYSKRLFENIQPPCFDRDKRQSQCSRGLPHRREPLRWSATFGLNRMPTRERSGIISFISSNRLPKISLPVSPENPVTFPPGRARLAISPVPIGSILLIMMIGMVVVAFMVAAVIGLNVVRMTSTPMRPNLRQALAIVPSRFQRSGIR